MDEASRADRRPQIPLRTGWSLADSLRLLEQRYGADQDDQVIDLTLLDSQGLGPATASALAEHGFADN